MINPLKMIGDAASKGKQGVDFAMQAMKIQQLLEKEEYEVLHGNIRLLITGNQNVKVVEIDGNPNEPLRQAMNEAIKKSQQSAAAKIMEVSKSMGLG